jgi:hypothetical protein
MTLVDFDKVSPVLQVISQGIYGIWWISLHNVKNPPNLRRTLNSVLRIHGVTLQNHTSTHQQHAESHQLRTMNARGHINSVP